VSAEQTTLGAFAPDLSGLTPAERDAFQAVRCGDDGPREYARKTDRSPGTVSNLLARAEEKLEGSA
jgi:DNA-directed RNA polymerase specialized sigma24 family protein